MIRGLELVKEFSDKFGQKRSERVSLLKEEEYELRHKLMHEENEEYLEACKKEHLEEVADALADQLYILFGTILAHGMENIIEEVFVEVHRSNMSKLDKNGNAIINGENGIYDDSKPIGKILKGDGFTPPDIDSILDKYFSNELTNKLMDDEFKKHLDKGIEIRESMLRSIIEDKLSKADFKKFKKFEELSDYFAGKVRVVQERSSFDLTKWGVFVDGETYWINEKEESAY